MITNGAGTDSNIELELKGIDGLPPVIRQIIFDAPINLGAWGIYRHFQRNRISEDWEIAAYAVDLKAKIEAMMRGGDSYSTRAFWINHPQLDRTYPWPNWQLKPKRNRNRLTRVAEVEGTNVEENYYNR